MRLIAIRQTLQDCPPEILRVAGFRESITHITRGTECEAFAVAVWQGVSFVQVINDLKCITWLPIWLFKLKDTRIPSDWVMNFFEGDVSIVVGPRFVAESAAAYDSMVNQEVLATTQFWQRVRERSVP